MQTHHEVSAKTAAVLCSAQTSADDADAVGTLKAGLGPTPLALLTIFVSPQADFDRTMAQAAAAFEGTDVVGCTTAGEVGQEGYEEGMIVAIGYPAARFASVSILIDELHGDILPMALDQIALERLKLQRLNPDKTESFGFLVVDGLSMREDALTASITLAMGDLPLFGGSAGDGTAFEDTFVALNGRVQSGAAVLTLVQTDHKARVFSIDHLEPGEGRMVVTDADPQRRVVKAINAEPAAAEYARIVGKDPHQLDKFTFASHPVIVRIGNTHHVRAIQQVNEAGELVFFSAIDVGMVLSVAQPRAMATHLDETLAELTCQNASVAIVGCDCILRRIEAEQTQVKTQVSAVLRKYGVLGFSTYGEQIGPLHVNQTMTGVAIFG